MRTIVLAMAIGLLAVNLALAGNCCTGPACCDQPQWCEAPDRCSDSCCCEKTCKVVCEIKKVKRTVWVVECEEFCPSLPNCGCSCGCDPCCCDAEDDCCSGKDPCGSLRNRSYVPPKCGKVRTRKKLVKKEIICEIPVYKCIVVCCEPGCCDAGCGGGEVETFQEDPAPLPEQTTDIAPLPPIVGTSYLKALKIGS